MHVMVEYSVDGKIIKSFTNTDGSYPIVGETIEIGKTKYVVEASIGKKHYIKLILSKLRRIDG